MNLRSIALAALLLSVGCEARLSLGAACARRSDCDGDLACVLGRCREECLTTDDCRVGERCLVQPESGQRACSVGAVDRCDMGACPSGFVCSADDECVNACGAIVACPDGVCTDGACLPRRADTDAGVVDAAPPDGESPDAGACVGPGCRRIVALTAGWQTFYAIDEDGRVWAWGKSDDGETADGVVAHDGCALCAPRPVAALDGVGGSRVLGARAAAGGEGLACILGADQEVVCWRGSGAPATIEWLDAGTFGPVEGAEELAAGRTHACARTTDGTVYCWGSGGGGRLGTGNEADASPRAAIATLIGPADRVWAASEHTYSLGTDGVLRGFGVNDRRSLGATVDPVISPGATPSPLPSFVALAMSEWASCVLGTDGHIRCWGHEDLLGSAATVDGTCGCTEVPQTLLRPAGVEWAGIAAGPAAGFSFYAWTTDGTLYSWGNRFERPFADDPTLHDGVPPVRTVAATQGGSTICALTREGDVWCWGTSDLGEVGRGDHDVGTTLFAPGPVDWPE